jgi:hypothetical protein
MATPANVVSSIVGAAAQGVASPVTSIVSVIGSIVSKAMDFIPDPAKKMELQQHAMDLQAQAAEQELDALTKQVQAAAQASSSDTSLWKARAFFCYGVTSAIFINYVGFPLLHAAAHLDIAPIVLPTNLLMMFAAIMLGLVGVPEGFGALKNLLGMVPDVMAMPGDSQVSVLGVKVANKS